MFGMFSLEPISHRGEIIETCHKLHLYATPLLISLCTLMTDTCTRLSFALLCLNSADMNFSLKYELFGIEGIPTGVVGYITISLSLSLCGKECLCFRDLTSCHTHTHTLTYTTHKAIHSLSPIQSQFNPSIQSKQNRDSKSQSHLFTSHSLQLHIVIIQSTFLFDSIRYDRSRITTQSYVRTGDVTHRGETTATRDTAS